ncbi:archaetidylserine decarboxylase [Paenibacillus shunpengii]|uniref:Phosphatidylserine decarboxylase proenzyme n=1 Tax=Paenibacillus shunpengii TaxID=2054424 RepID=A0ABW5ST86_9BACL
MSKPLLRLMTELSSRKWISRLTGTFSKSSASRLLIPWFIRTYEIDPNEAELEPGEYPSLNAFFTRRLKPHARPLHEHPDSLLSPVDGKITAMSPITKGTILNIKGHDYTLADLLNQSPHMEKYKNGWAVILYLSPKDYHRIHAPVTGKQVESEHIRGKVYPVNDFGLRHMRTVLSRNERLITYIKHEHGEIALVKVGAMNVSSIQYADDKVKAWQRGDELAYFEFGSTVVLLCENGTFVPREDLAEGDSVRMGDSLGVIVSKAAEIRRPS